MMTDANRLLNRLRMETRDAHARIEGSLDLVRPCLTLDHYRRIVGRIHGFHAAWEPAMAAALGDEAFFAPRRKLDRLRADLRWMGVDVADLPAGCPTPHLDGAAAAIGSMYVVEGATLGGKVIARHLERALGLSGGVGYSFFLSYGEAAGEMWAAFRARLAACPSADDDAATRAAAAAFDAFDRHVCRAS